MSTLTRRVSSITREEGGVGLSPLAPLAPLAKYEPAPGPSLPPSAAASATDLAVFDEEDEEVAAVSSGDEEAARIPALPPIDGGTGAYAFLLAATTIEVMVWGLPFSVGILQAYWRDMFPDDQSTVTLAATLPNGILYFAGAVLGP